MRHHHRDGRRLPVSRSTSGVVEAECSVCTRSDLLPAWWALRPSSRELLSWASLTCRGGSLALSSFWENGGGTAKEGFIDEQAGASHWFGCSTSMELCSLGVRLLIEEGIPAWGCLGSVASLPSFGGCFHLFIICRDSHRRPVDGGEAVPGLGVSLCGLGHEGFDDSHSASEVFRHLGERGCFGTASVLSSSGVTGRIAFQRRGWESGHR